MFKEVVAASGTKQIIPLLPAYTSGIRAAEPTSLRHLGAASSDSEPLLRELVCGG
jgi:hypothetical protein